MGCPFCERRPGCSAPLCYECRLKLSQWRDRYAREGTEFTPSEVEAIFRLAYSCAPGGFTPSEAMTVAVRMVMGADWKSPQWYEGVECLS